MTQEKVSYENFRVTIPEDQRDKFCSAIGEGEAVSLRFNPEALTGCKDRIDINEQQFKILTIALEKGREVIINMSEEQVQRHGGYLISNKEQKKRHRPYLDDDIIFLPV